MKMEPGGELRFDHSIIYPDTTLSLTVYFQVSDDGQRVRWVEAKPSIHPDGILLGCDMDRYILAANALGFSVKNKTWISLAAVVTPLEEKGIPFWYVPATNEDVMVRREIFEIQEIRKTNSRNKEINQRGKELAERLPALMEGRASEYGIIEWFEHVGNGGGWLFKPKGYHGSFMGSHGPDRFAGGDDYFPTDQGAFVALERYVKTSGKGKKQNKAPILPFFGSVSLDPSGDSDIVRECAGRQPMKNYLSFGAGVNSVALYLLMQDMGIEFEAVYLDHGTDWPETREYVEMFRKKFPLTVLAPEYKGHATIIGYCQQHKVTPSLQFRWCTGKFKTRPFERYVTSPCFVHLGIDAGEQHRARMSSVGGRENRYILIEEGIDRDGCKQIIKDHGLPVPRKSGCFICPFQRAAQWRELRRNHPDLFCMAQQLETAQNEQRIALGKPLMWYRDKPLRAIANEKQSALPGFESMEYPPCQCGL